ncbi:MAG: Crp/Fnr family transcriptional regulator [Clostridia bacterium]|nr:Crp/Fnr family transcriptional regulator [Clostridia bacterium]
MKSPENIKFLSEHFLAWEHMSENEKAALLDNAVIRQFDKGTNLHGVECECMGFLMVKHGMLRTYMLSEEGREITLYRLGPGDMCVLSASCVLSAITFEVNIDAEENTELIMISAPYFAELSESNLHVECFAYKLVTERFSDVMWTMQQVLFMSMDKRLAVFLWDELTKIEGDTIHITHEQAARYIGSAREVVTRMLKYFAEDGVVELSRGGIKVTDRKKLRALAQ